MSCIRKIVDAQDGLQQSQGYEQDLATLLRAKNRFLARNIDEVCICVLTKVQAKDNQVGETTLALTTSNQVHRKRVFLERTKEQLGL